MERYKSLCESRAHVGAEEVYLWADYPARSSGLLNDYAFMPSELALAHAEHSCSEMGS